MWFILYVSLSNPTLIIESPATQTVCADRLAALSQKSLFLSHCIEGRKELSQIINTYLRLGSI